MEASISWAQFGNLYRMIDNIIGNLAFHVPSPCSTTTRVPDISLL